MEFTIHRLITIGTNVLPPFLQKSQAIKEKYDEMRYSYIRSLNLASLGAVFVCLSSPILGYLNLQITPIQFLYSIQFGVLISVLVAVAFVYVREAIVKGTFYNCLSDQMEELSQISFQLLLDALNITPAATQMPPVFNPFDTLRNNVWQDANEAIQSEDAVSMPVLDSDAHDPISGQVLEGNAYVVDDSIYSAVNETTIRELYHPDTWRGRGKNPFTNLVVQQIRKVRVSICDSPADFETVKSAYEQSMNETRIAPAAAPNTPVTTTTEAFDISAILAGMPELAPQQLNSRLHNRLLQELFEQSQGAQNNLDILAEAAATSTEIADTATEDVPRT